MLYLIAAIVVCWIVGGLLLSKAGDLKPMQQLRTAEAAMETGATADEKRSAAREVLELIEQNELAGVIVDDARKAAEKVLRAWPGS